MSTRTDARSSAPHVADGHDLIRVHGARENNLQDVSIEIPKRRLTTFTGVSGSGKSSLVFGTIAAESQRLINETYNARSPCMLVIHVSDGPGTAHGRSLRFAYRHLLDATSCHPDRKALVNSEITSWSGPYDPGGWAAGGRRRPYFGGPRQPAPTLRSKNRSSRSTRDSAPTRCLISSSGRLRRANPKRRLSEAVSCG